MRDIILLWRILAREWRSQLLYVFRVLGIDDTHLDWATYSYGFYIGGLAVVWGIVSGSMMLQVMSQIGHAFPGTVIHSISVILTIRVSITSSENQSSPRCPNDTPHGWDASLKKCWDGDRNTESTIFSKRYFLREFSGHLASLRCHGLMGTPLKPLA